MTYSEFEALVAIELGPDGTRRGIEAQRARWIRDALVDLQRFIPAFRTGHKSRYVETDMEKVGYAQVGTLPAGAKPKAFYIACESGIAIPAAPKTSGEVTSWATLAAVPTTKLSLPFTIVWVDATTLDFRVTQLRAGTHATDTANGVQRPADYAAGTNEKVWYLA